jgi:hypothetical protein
MPFAPPLDAPPDAVPAAAPPDAVPAAELPPLACPAWPALEAVPPADAPALAPPLPAELSGELAVSPQPSASKHPQSSHDRAGLMAAF